VLSFGLSLLGIGKNIMGWLSAAFKWIFASWHRVVVAIAVLEALVIAILLIQVANWKERYTVEATAHITTKVNVANAQKVAADMNRHQVEVIKQKYDVIAEKSEIDYEKRLVDSRSVVRNWLRIQAAKNTPEGTGASGGTQVQPEASGAGEVPDIPKGFAVLPISDLDLIAGAYDKLAALQDAARAVSEVKPNE
jgi:hypothetical protein